MYLFLNPGNSQALVIFYFFVCLAILVFFLHIKLSLALSCPPLAGPYALSHREPLCTCLFLLEKQSSRERHWLPAHHITSVQCDTDRRIIGGRNRSGLILYEQCFIAFPS